MNDLLLQEEKEDTRRYRWTLWWVQHQARLKKIGIGVFFGIDALIFLFVFWTLLDTFAISYGKEQRAVEELVVNNQEDLSAYTRTRSASAISIGEARVFSIGEKRYDFYSQLENTNTDWWAEFSYTFVFSGGETKTQNGYILPGETKPVVELAYEGSGTLSDVQLVLKDVIWHRIDHRHISDYESWSKDRMAFEIKDVLFSQESLENNQTAGRVTFTVTNRTAFSYYEPVFVILLKRGSSVVGVHRTTLQSFDSGATQEVALNWFGLIPSVSQVEVVPQIHVLDIDSYKPLVGESTIDTRDRVF